jgi:4-diphosphocytidyl-2-C-methyl-D-erythritol kinase
MKLTLQAPAKINLFLEVKDRRPDGYHTIESVMHTVSLYDEIILESRPAGITLSCSRPDLPVDERNLAFRAAAALQRELGASTGVHITLTKNIPLGAGLGGGSSDAAAVLTGLLALWDRQLPAGRLNRIAARLGADVPFFLSGGTAVARGIGEKLAPLAGITPARFILVYPGFGVSTPWVYQHLRLPLTRKQKITKIKAQLAHGCPPQEWGQYLYNRLEEVVFPAYPEIAHVKDELQQLGCFGLMSGSGSTVFGMLSSSENGEGEHIRSILEKKYRNVWLVASTLASKMTS